MNYSLESVFFLLCRVDARIAVPMFTGWRSTSAGSGCCDDKRVAHRRSTRASSELIFLTIYHFIDVLIFFVFCSIRRQSWSGACVDAAGFGSGRRGERTRDKRPEVRRAVFSLFFPCCHSLNSRVADDILCVWRFFENRRAPRRSVLSRPARHDNDARC